MIKMLLILLILFGNILNLRQRRIIEMIKTIKIFQIICYNLFIQFSNIDLIFD